MTNDKEGYFLRFAVVDDEPYFLEQISESIKSIVKGTVTIDCYQSAVDFYNKSTETEYDAYFIDIDMPVINGFELSQKLTDDNNCVPVVYVTGRDELVIQAFRYKALGFVRKQNMNAELKYALNTLYKETGGNLVYINVTEIQSNGGKEHKIPIESIEYIQTDGHNTVIHLTTRKNVTVRKPLSFYCKNELFRDFSLIDSGTFVNLKMINVIDNKVVFNDGNSFPISKRRYRAVYDAWIKSRRRLLI